MLGCVGFSSGKAMWEMTVAKDNNGDECSCLGAAVRPVLDSNYESSEQLFMVRAFLPQPPLLII